jgi:hypothetical protein
MKYIKLIFPCIFALCLLFMIFSFWYFFSGPLILQVYFTLIFLAAMSAPMYIARDIIGRGKCWFLDWPWKD